MANRYNGTRTETSSIGQFFIRLVVSAVVLAITAFLTPGFTISGIFPLLLAALVISLLDIVASRYLGINASPFGRGITGFIIAAAIIYVTRYLVAGYDVTIIGALIGALIYGIVDAIIPGRAM